MGGSVQVLIGNKAELKKKHMMPTGAQFLHELFTKNPHEPTSFNTQEEIEQMKEYVLKELIGFKPSSEIPLIYGSSMIITVMKQIGIKLEPHEDSVSHPYKTYASLMNEFTHSILPYTFEERVRRYSEIQTGFMWAIDKGFTVATTIAEHFNSPYIIPSNANIAQGIIYSMVKTESPASSVAL